MDLQFGVLVSSLRKNKFGRNRFRGFLTPKHISKGFYKGNNVKEVGTIDSRGLNLKKIIII